jgi:nucleoside-diphosphate-sugar epimerase
MDAALVIAGTSFVGRHLCRRLAQRAISFQATSRAPRTGFLPYNLLRPDATSALLQSVQPRWIFVCAGATTVSTAEQMHALHVTATEALLEGVARHVPDAVTVLFGSAAEYGPVPPELLPIREDAPCHPQSGYGQSKLAQLQVARRVASERDLRVHVVRPFNLIGPGLGRQYLAASLCERLVQAKKDGRSGPFQVSNAEATRDFVDVRDAAAAALKLAFDAPPQRGSIGLYNIATGKETSVLTLSEHLCQLAGGFHAVNLGRADSRSGIDRSCGDATRLAAATGWQPAVSWQQSIEDMWPADGAVYRLRIRRSAG